MPVKALTEVLWGVIQEFDHAPSFVKDLVACEVSEEHHTPTHIATKDMGVGTIVRRVCIVCEIPKKSLASHPHWCRSTSTKHLVRGMEIMRLSMMRKSKCPPTVVPTKFPKEWTWDEGACN